MKQHTKRVVVAIGALLLPAVAFAQYNINNSSTLFGAALGIINALIPVVIALAIIYIIYGIVMSFTTNDEEKRGKAHHHVLYSVIGLFVIVSIWGLVNILVNTAGLNNTTPQNIPTVTNLNINGGVPNQI